MDCTLKGCIISDTTYGQLLVPVDNIIVSTTEFSLYQNYPNPFNPTTRIQYTVNSTQKVTLRVYDLLGREVATLVNEEKPPGEYEVKFTVGQESLPVLPSGIYFYQLIAGDYAESKKMVLLR
jgi:hypothetical protein